MRKNKVFIMLLLVAFALLAFTGCMGNDNADPTTEREERPSVDSLTEGGTSSNQTLRYISTEDSIDAEFTDAAVDVRSMHVNETESATGQQGRMLILTAEIDLETKDFDQSKAGIEAALLAVGGHTQDSQLNGDGTEGNLRSYWAVLRVPAEHFDAFVDDASNQGSVLSVSKGGDDVTDSFFDNEARIVILEAEEAELIGFMEQANTMSELFEVRDRISVVRTEIERLRGQNNRTADLAAMGTVAIALEEVQAITPPAEEGFFPRAGHTFTSSMEVFVGFIQGLILVIIAILPFALVFAGIPAVVAIYLLKRRKKKKLDVAP